MANDKGITFKVRTWIVLLVIAAVVGFATYKIVQYKKDVVTLSQEMQKKDKSIKRFTIVVDGLKEEVSEAHFFLIKSQRALKKSEQYAERLRALNIKKVNAIGELNLKIAAMEDSLQVYKSSVPVIYDTVIYDIADVEVVDERPMIELPASFGWEDRWATSWGVITEDGNGEAGFTIDELPIEIVLGSRGIFKPVYVSSVATPNPYVQVTKQNFVVTNQTKKTAPILVAGSIGVIGGFLTGIMLTR